MASICSDLAVSYRIGAGPVTGAALPNASLSMTTGAALTSESSRSGQYYIYRERAERRIYRAPAEKRILVY